MSRWGFHAVTLASGTADAALVAKRELLNRLKANSELTSWTRGCSYRVVDRTELEELVRVAHAEEVEVKRREEKAPEEAARLEKEAEGGDADLAPQTEEGEGETTRVPLTPPLLALAFQRLLDEMHAGWAKWEQWQKDREANKECYKVVDPRQPDVIAQEIAMQRKVMAAYKAARARKKMARQKAREMKAKSVSQEMSPGRMETVQEGEEALEGEGDDEEHSDDEFGQFGSDMSDDDVGDTVEVDDPMELLWSAFSQADVEGRGLLSIAQTRLGVVNVLGIGVTTNELTEALVRFKLPYPFNVSFDVFADLVAFFRKGDSDNQDPAESSADTTSHIPPLKGVAVEQRKGQGRAAAGSAAEAIRARLYHAV
ncbi:hypothetical protein JG688_00005967 [Phytophthora aleatoria]|uniref:Uncharacterized protein n=1 Tax=Phytophthora aleatoria TaxID=2496075 RepID=A0A8J5M987_9STRA|nr:hypothetical protein JG688_00005967 [Phytophthora aleatoria]